MRHLIYATTAAMAAFMMSGTAQAGEIRIEGHGGVSWQGNSTKATVGAAVGYDMSVGALGNGVFAGVEESVDSAAGGSGTRWGPSGRLGIKVLSLGALYGVAGYHYGSGPNATSIGAGYQQGLGPVYGKVEYRHYMNEGGWRPGDALTLGFGVKF